MTWQSRVLIYLIYSDCLQFENDSDRFLKMDLLCRVSIVFVEGNMAYMDTMPDLMSETMSMGTLGKQAEYDRRRRRKYVDFVSFKPRGHNTHSSPCHSDQTIVVTQSHSSLLLTCFTSSLEPAYYIAQNSSSKLFSATFWTCWFNMLHTAITIHHFNTFTVSLKLNYPAKTLFLFVPPQPVCLSDWPHWL